MPGLVNGFGGKISFYDRSISDRISSRDSGDGDREKDRQEIPDDEENYASSRFFALGETEAKGKEEGEEGLNKKMVSR